MASVQDLLPGIPYSHAAALDLVRLAESCGRPADMCAAIRLVVDDATTQERVLTPEERLMFSVSFKNRLSPLRGCLKMLALVEQQETNPRRLAGVKSYASEMEDAIVMLAGEVLGLIGDKQTGVAERLLATALEDLQVATAAAARAAAAKAKAAATAAGAVIDVEGVAPSAASSELPSSMTASHEGGAPSNGSAAAPSSGSPPPLQSQLSSSPGDDAGRAAADHRDASSPAAAAEHAEAGEQQFLQPASPRERKVTVSASVVSQPVSPGHRASEFDLDITLTEAAEAAVGEEAAAAAHPSRGASLVGAPTPTPEGAREALNSAVDALIYCLKLSADYCRYVAEAHSDGDVMRRHSDLALALYSKASAHAAAHLHPAHPSRLGVLLNFSVFLFEVRHCEAEAYEVGVAGLADAAEASDRDAAAAAAAVAAAAAAAVSSVEGGGASTTDAAPAPSTGGVNTALSTGGESSSSSSSSWPGGPLSPADVRDSEAVQRLLRENMGVWRQVLQVNAMQQREQQEGQLAQQQQQSSSSGGGAAVASGSSSSSSSTSWFGRLVASPNKKQAGGEGR